MEKVENRTYWKSITGSGIIKKSNDHIYIYIYRERERERARERCVCVCVCVILCYRGLLPRLFTKKDIQKNSVRKSPPIYIYHHHHIVLVARISLTLSRHSSLSFIALGRSSGQHPVSSHSCWMYVRAGRPAFARPCVGIHKSTSLMSSSLLLQQCPAGLVRLTWIVFVIGGRWPYS